MASTPMASPISAPPQMPRLLYCTPTLHNPTTATMPVARREALVAVARRYGVAIVEDDIYAPLLTDGPPALAALAPDIVYHVAGLSKCVSPALRLAYLVAPEARQAARLGQALRATALMPAPLTARLADSWIGDGTAALMVGALRREAMARQAMASARLPPAPVLPPGRKPSSLARGRAGLDTCRFCRPSARTGHHPRARRRLRHRRHRARGGARLPGGRRRPSGTGPGARPPCRRPGPPLSGATVI
jgi:hypothetical protein